MTRELLDRRQLLLSGAATWVSAAMARSARAGTSAEPLDRLFDAFVDADLDASPEETTALGHTLGEPMASATTEIERYCVWPGQACSYLLDKLAILRLRDRARAALGARFDLRQFHDAVLSCGAVPQGVLDSVIDRYTEARRV